MQQALWKLPICRTVILLHVLESVDYKTINGNESPGNGNPLKAFLSINAKMLIFPLYWRSIMFLL